MAVLGVARKVSRELIWIERLINALYLH